MPSEKQSSDPDKPPVRISAPTLPDGAAMWRIARESQVLDLNSSYAYLLFCRDFAATSRVAVVDGEVAGFVLGYRRPDRADCLFVWQIAVDARHRGRRISSHLLDDLVLGSAADGAPVRSVETTITADNTASQALFASFARRWGARIATSDLMSADHFPDGGHAAEPLYRIGPLEVPPTRTAGSPRLSATAPADPPVPYTRPTREPSR